jgi:hypothetical protein
VPVAINKSPVVVSGDNALNAAAADVCPVPPELIASVAERPAAVPDVFWFKVGTSATAILRNVGCAADPDVGPAKNVFCVWVFSVKVSVPFAVSGELPTVYNGTALESDNPTEDNAPVAVAVAVIAFVALLIDQVIPPPSARVNPLACDRKLLVRLTLMN